MLWTRSPRTSKQAAVMARHVAYRAWSFYACETLRQNLQQNLDEMDSPLNQKKKPLRAQLLRPYLIGLPHMFSPAIRQRCNVGTVRWCVGIDSISPSYVAAANVSIWADMHVSIRYPGDLRISDRYSQGREE